MSFPKTNLNIYGKKNTILSHLFCTNQEVFPTSNSHALVPFLFYGKKCTHRRSAHHPSSPLSPCSPSAFLSLPLLPQGRTRPTDGASFPACAHDDHRADAAQSAHGGGKRASSASSQGRKGEKVHFAKMEKKFRGRRKRDEKRSSYSCSFDCCSSCCTRGKVRPGNSGQILNTDDGGSMSRETKMLQRHY